MTEAESFRERCRLLLRLELEGDARVAQALLRDNDALCQNILEDPDRRRRILAFTDPKDAIGDGYDHLDDLIAGLLRLCEPGPEQRAQHPERVFYQPTPARHALELIRRGELRETDVVVDLGAGLGHVVLLVALLTSATAVGIEIEPAFVDSARRSARALQLERAHFRLGDARAADFSRGTLFYLYTPFRGATLQAVLARLRGEARRRPIRLASFGPCTPALAAEPWLTADSAPVEDRITFFHAS